MLNRKTSREQAFILIFEKVFNDLPTDEIIETATTVRDFKTDEYCVEIFNGVYRKVEELDNIIAENTSGWNISRISKVSLCVLRLALYEILYRDDIPFSVSVNEAVELCKKFATTDDASFVNGILGSVSKKYNK